MVKVYIPLPLKVSHIIRKGGYIPLTYSDSLSMVGGVTPDSSRILIASERVKERRGCLGIILSPFISSSHSDDYNPDYKFLGEVDLPINNSGFTGAIRVSAFGRSNLSGLRNLAMGLEKGLGIKDVVVTLDSEYESYD